MNFWGYVYGVPAALVLVSALASRRWKLSIAGVVIFSSWVLSSAVVIQELPDTHFLAYFAFDAIAAEIMVFMLIHRFSAWNAIFLAALIAQLFTHLGYWGPMMPPRRYHEILNAFYILQMLATIIGSWRAILRMDLDPPAPERITLRSKAIRPGPRFTGAKLIDPKEPGKCPAIVRSYA